MSDQTRTARAVLFAAAAAALAGCSAATTAAPVAPAPTAAPTDQSCTADSVSGDWTRITKGDVAMDAVWRLQPDGAIMCTGADCARAAGLPTQYTLTPEGIAIKFQWGSMTGECAVEGDALLMGGGVDGGGFSFVRALR